MSLTITVRHTADAAHRIPVLSGVGKKCASIHGHTWRFAWSFAADNTDPENIEFGAIKRILHDWVDEYFDHGYACGPDDDLGTYLSKLGHKVLVVPDWPTTETLVTYFAHVTTELLPDLELTELVLREGNSNSATWRPDICERRA